MGAVLGGAVAGRDRPVDGPTTGRDLFDDPQGGRDPSRPAGPFVTAVVVCRLPGTRELLRSSSSVSISITWSSSRDRLRLSSPSVTGFRLSLSGMAGTASLPTRSSGLASIVRRDSAWVGLLDMTTMRLVGQTCLLRFHQRVRASSRASGSTMASPIKTALALYPQGV